MNYQKILASFIKKEDLEILYHKNKMTQHNLAEFYGISVMAINKRFRKYGIISRNKARRNQIGKNHSLWKETPSYRTIHKRLEYQRGKPIFCEECKTTDKNKKYEWANISGNYNDVIDFRRLCKECHNKEHPKTRDNLGRFSN